MRVHFAVACFALVSSSRAFGIDLDLSPLRDATVGFSAQSCSWDAAGLAADEERWLDGAAARPARTVCQVCRRYGQIR